TSFTIQSARKPNSPLQELLAEKRSTARERGVLSPAAGRGARRSLAASPHVLAPGSDAGTASTAPRESSQQRGASSSPIELPDRALVVGPRRPIAIRIVEHSTRASSSAGRRARFIGCEARTPGVLLRLLLSRREADPTTKLFVPSALRFGLALVELEDVSVRR